MTFSPSFLAIRRRTNSVTCLRGLGAYVSIITAQTSLLDSALQISVHTSQRVLLPKGATRYEQ